MSNQDTIKIKIPRQELDHSSYFDCDETSVTQWISSLPTTNISQMTRQLYLALTELNQVQMLPSKRMLLLEKLRTPTYYVTNNLCKHYLNQPIVLADQPRKVAELAHTLHLQLAIGFTIVAVHTVSLGKHSGTNKPAQQVAIALHRTITDHSLNMLRHYQLYQSVKEGVWSNLHQLYSLARQHNILDQKIEDKESSSCNIEACYFRALLMGCCKPDQLRQEDLKAIFPQLTHWAQLCELKLGNSDGLFLIDPAGDKPPVYRELYPAAIAPHWLSLHTRRLVDHLQQLRDNSTADQVNISEQGCLLSRDLLNQLILCWGSMSRRTFMRMESEQSLDICVGLNAAHHFISGELSFEALIEKPDAKALTMHKENPFLSKETTQQHHYKKDVWSSAYESNLGQTNAPIESIKIEAPQSEPQAGKNSYRSHHVSIINSSAHGYCVEWPKDGRALIKTGEIVGIKEARSHNWSLAVICWVSHKSSQQAQFGLKLISPSAVPYGARIIHKTGAPTEYIRAFILPKTPTTQQAVTLLTPRMPFRNGQKVVLNQRANEVQIHLGSRTNTAGNYNQFKFHRINNLRSRSPDNHKQNDDFDSLWGNL